MAAQEERTPYCWLVQVPEHRVTSGGSKWSPLRSQDSARLENALAAKETGPIPVDSGRYDVELPRRRMRPAYWEEDERRVLRGLWFYGDQTPYEEGDSEQLEAAFQQVQAGKVALPFRVPVNQGCHNVCFDISKEDPEAPTSSVLSYFSWGGTTQTSAEGGTATPNAQTGPGTATIPQHSDAATPASASMPPQTDTAAANAATTTRYTFVQESINPLPGQAPAETWQVWRGSTLPPSDDETEENGLPAKIDCLVFVAHGASRCHDIRADPLGFREDVADLQHDFHDDVTRLRRLSWRYFQQSSKDGAVVRGRVEFVPIDWWDLIHVEVGIVKRIQKVVPAPSGLRNLQNIAIADTLIYQKEEWRERAAKEMLDKMKRLHALFTSRTPEYSGKIALIGHSLGSVLMFDVLRSGNFTFSSGFLVDESANSGSGETAPGQLPVPCCIFLAGAPLGMFLSMLESPWQIQRSFRGLSVSCPSSNTGGSWRLFNVLHPGDPFAYRLEPLLNSESNSLPPKTISSKGRFFTKVGEWMGTVGSLWALPSPSRPHVNIEKPIADSKTSEDLLVIETVKSQRNTQFFGAAAGAAQPATTIDRVDYVLQATMFESMNEVQNAIESHGCYFANEDFARFVVEQTLSVIYAPSKDEAAAKAAQDRRQPWQRKPTIASTKVRASQLEGLKSMQQAHLTTAKGYPGDAQQ